MAKIKNLNEFKKNETFFLLNERASYIKKLIDEVMAIRKLPVEVLNILEKSGVSVMNLIRSHTELIFVLYRSMFQRAAWEDSSRCEITEDAYFYDEESKKIHTEIKSHVDYVLAHQDNISSLNENKRGIYPPVNDENGNKYYATWSWIKLHAHELSPLIDLMKEAIKTTYFQKFNEHLPKLLS